MILVCSLLGTPLPAQAANGMADMMRIMMEMFFWMMSGSSGGMSSVNPYSMGGLGNPLLGGGGWGNSPWRLGGNQSYLPYNKLGMYSPSLYGIDLCPRWNRLSHLFVPQGCRNSFIVNHFTAL